MTVESENSDFIYVPETSLITCPLIDLCRLPKHDILCKTPDCKILCSEYLTKNKKLNPKD